MKKIPTLFLRDPDDRSRVLPEINPECQWLLDDPSSAQARRKLDGTCCLVRDGRLYKRREIKPGKEPPLDFEEVQYDEATFKRVGWVPVGMDPADQYHREAFEREEGSLLDGTYELVGPRIQGNPEGIPAHVLLAHSTACVYDLKLTPQAPEMFDEIYDFLRTRDIEGLVFVGPEGQMAKIKKRDLGLTR